MQRGAAGAGREGAFGGKQGEFGQIVVLAEVGEDEVGGRGIELGGEVAGHGVVGEVAETTHDALLEGPGIAAIAEHFEIVVGFEHGAIGGIQLLFDVFRKVAEVGDQDDAHALSAEREGDGIGGIMGNGEGRNFDIADLEGVPGGESLDTLHPLLIGGRPLPLESIAGGGGEEDGGSDGFGEAGQASDVVAVLVSDQDGIKRAGRAAGGGQAAQQLAAAESGIHE